MAALIRTMTDIRFTPDHERRCEQAACFIATEVMLDEAAKRY